MIENNKSEQIKLILPVNPAYVSAARLTASSVANRLGFDIDEIEDIKVAVSEACTYIIKHISSHGNSFKVEFDFISWLMNISISIQSESAPPMDEYEMGLLVIKALTDDLKINYDNGCLSINISKKHVQSSSD